MTIQEPKAAPITMLADSMFTRTQSAQADTCFIKKPSPLTRLMSANAQEAAEYGRDSLLVIEQPLRLTARKRTDMNMSTNDSDPLHLTPFFSKLIR